MKRLKLITLLTLLSVSFLATAQNHDFNVSEIPENLKKDANSVIRFENLFVEIHSQKSMTLSIKRAVTVLNKLGDANKYVTVGYDKNSKIKNIKTIVYNAFGKEIKKVKSKEYKDISPFDGFSLYTDNRLLYYEHVPISYPYTIYYEYQYETVNTGFIPSWSPVDSYLTAVVESSYALSVPKELGIRVKEQHFENYNVSKNNSESSVNYSLTNQEVIKREPYSPDLEKFTPFVRIGLHKFSLEGINGEATNWQEFGKWRYDYLKNGNDEIGETVKLEVKELVKDVESPIEKAKIIYDYVQNKTRYISVQEGIGGWMPINANEVHKVAYGDCKGLTNYTKTLLDAVGVKSHYTVIWAGEDKRNVEKEFFSMQGNHIILNLPTDEGDIWLECTSQKVPFGHLGDFTDDRDALVITPEGGVIKHTKVYKPEENLQITKGAYTLDVNGLISAKVAIESYGTQYDMHLGKYDGKSPKEQDVLFKKYFSNINNIKFKKIELSNNKKDGKYEEALEFTAEDYAIKSGNQLLVTLNAFNKYSNVPKRVRTRKLPFEIPRGFVDIDEVEITLPSSLKVEFVPEKVELVTKFGSYTMTITKIAEHTYSYKRKLQIEEGNYPKEAYEAYRIFRKKIAKYDNSKIIQTK